MTNNVIGFDIGGVKGVIDSNTVIVRCRATSTATDSSYILMSDLRTNAAYSVPTGKKAKIILINEWESPGTSSKVVYSDAQNSGTNAVDLFNPAVVSTTLFDSSIFISNSAPAGKYFNMGVGSTAGTKLIDCYIVEENA